MTNSKSTNGELSYGTLDLLLNYQGNKCLEFSS